MTVSELLEMPRRWVRSLTSKDQGEFVIDMFAGGGGTSKGIEGALGRKVDVAMNHDEHAIKIHKLNHPNTFHFLCDVREVDPRQVMPDRKIGLLWLSPDCTHHSRAKGPRGTPWPNVWLGVSVENQWAALARVPILMRTPAAKRFLSCEPLLGPLDIHLQFLKRRADDAKLHWIICGGESGPKARPMAPAWARALRDDCLDAGVPFFFKQWGEWRPLGPDDCGSDFQRVGYFAPYEGFKNGISSGGYPHVFRASTKAAGRLLDGKEWNQFPEVD